MEECSVQSHQRDETVPEVHREGLAANEIQSEKAINAGLDKDGPLFVVE
jgi:hypothetical protein